MYSISKKIIFVLACTCFLSSCFKNITKSTVAYFNDFEKGDETGFSYYGPYGLMAGSKIDSFNHGKVLGRFWEKRMEFEYNNLPPHNLINVELILNAHGYWEGNKILGGLPDLWNIAMDGNLIYQTTFSNSSEKQSYPDWYDIGAIPNPPRANAWDTHLPGVCSLEGVDGGTISYKITFTRPHSGNSVRLTINDVLHNSECEKSWSIDNLKITTIVAE